MKIRLDFVTNSSSSSFTCVALYSEELYKFLQKLIAEKKYREQPDWVKNQRWIHPESELHIGWVWEELKLDERTYKVQTTEEYGSTDKESIYKYVSSFFEGLTPEESRNLKELIFDVYQNENFQTRKYKDQTDGFTGFDFRGDFLKLGKGTEPQSEKTKQLLESIDKLAVDPETVDLSMKSVAFATYKIDGEGIYDPDSKRYAHLDKSFLDKIKLGWVDPDYTAFGREQMLDEEKRRKWGEHLRKLYAEAIDDIGAIALDNISSRSDVAVVFDSIDGAVDKFTLQAFMFESISANMYDIDRLPASEVAAAKERCFITYLENTISQLNEANKNRGSGQAPVAVIWESQMHDYLMKHSSLGNITPEPVVGPNGTVRLKVPEKHKKTINYALTEMVARWPSRIINPKTKTYEKILKDVEACKSDIGYASADEFFDAYGFSVKQEAINTNASKAGGFEYEKSKKNEVTIVKYSGNEPVVSIPEEINGGIVKTIGKEAFWSSNNVEEIIIPDSVETIRAKAFGFCKKLKKVQLSNNVSKIPAGSFDGCESLEQINIPDMMETIPSGLFKDCPLKSLHIGKKLLSVDKEDFYREPLVPETFRNGFNKTAALESITVDPGNRNLSSMGAMILSYDGKVLYAMLGRDSSCEIPDGVEIIADKAFMYQSKLKTIALPNTLRVIGNSAFERTGLLSVAFPDSLRIIGTNAFHACQSLKSVEFEDGVEEIYSQAFEFTAIREVVLPASLKRLRGRVFDPWQLEYVEPESWKIEIEKQAYNYSTRDKYNTSQEIEDLVNKGKQDAISSLLEENKLGFGLLAAMMSYLQSEKADEIGLKERLNLEALVISKEMETILGTDLKAVLSFYEDKATDQLNNCINYIKTEVGNDIIEEYFAKVKSAFKDSRADLGVLLDGVMKMIKREA